MANTGSQSEAIRDLLVERLELFDSSLDVSEGSPLWSQVIEPVFAALGTDPFDTDIREFLKDRIKQEFPTIGAEEGDVLVDLLVTPLEVLLEPLKREIQIVRQGQSANSVDTMRLEDARDLAANFFTEWSGGARASASVRIYYSSPTYVNVLATIPFTTPSGLKFYPTTPQVVRPETMLLQRSGTEYYIDVPVIAENAGDEYNVDKGTITSASGLSGWTRITNLAKAEGGLSSETSAELLTRTRSSLTERSLNVRRGIVARLANDFPSIVDVEAVGYGDPEMERDVLTGGGEGNVIATGICIIIGQFVLMFSMFEQRGELGTAQISEGDEIELNYWKFLYDVEASSANETFLVDTILFDSRNAITEMPSILLFRMDGVPSVTAPVAGSLPGVLPAVFCVVRSTGKLEISDIPGGITNPDTARGTIEVEDGEVHIGGHYDVWMRPSSTTETSADIDSGRSESSHLEASDLTINGESAGAKHMVHRSYAITVAVSSGSFQLGEVVTGASSGATGVVSKITAPSTGSRILTLKEMGGTEFTSTEGVTGGTSSAAGTVSSIDSFDFVTDGAVEAGMLLSIVSGTDEGVYRIIKVEGPFLYLDVELTTTAVSQYFRILDEITVDLFNPKAILVPFGDAAGDDLRTTIGSKVLRTDINLQDYGVAVGDSIEILDGDDKGIYTIQSWDEDYGGSGPVVAVEMTATNSSLTYQAYSTSAPLQRPLVRIQPGGVKMLDPSGQDSGYTIPYALPVDGRAKAAFSASKAVAVGSNGFLLMDPGSDWAPTDDYTVDIDADFTPSEFVDFYTDGDFKRCYTDECLDCAGYIAVISVYDDGSMFLDSNLPSNAQSFLQDMKDWFLGVIDSFDFGGDEEELINGFSPLKFGPNEDTALNLILQFEICIPFEIFDGCNNVFVAIPEFDWESEFESADTFEEAIGRYNDGAMTGAAPGLLQASSGDIITLLAGANAGSYVIDAVYEYQLITSGHVTAGDEVDLASAYKVAVAVIRDQFPVPAFNGLEEFFSETPPSWTVPAAPDLPFEVFEEGTGNVVDGWDWVETSLTWFFTWMRNLGFDLPEEVELDVPETMKAFWQLLFTGYIVGKPTCAQYTRLYFVEPTSCTVYAPQVCSRYQYALPVHAGDAITGETITLPLPDLEGVPVSLSLVRLSGTTALTGALPASAATAATIEELAEILQETLDADAAYVTFSGPADATGELTVTQVEGGVDEWIYLDAYGEEDGFRLFGFYEGEPGRWPQTDSAGASWPAPVMWQVLTWSTAGVDVVGGTFTLTTGMTQLVVDASANNPDATGDPFQVGESVTGTSGATGTVWGVFDDSGGTSDACIWLVNVSGTFSGGDTVTGDTSGATMPIGTVEEAPTVDASTFLAGAVSPGTHIYTDHSELFEAITDSMLEELEDAMSPGGSSSLYDTVDKSSTFSAQLAYVEDGDEYYLTLTIVDSSYTEVVTEFTIDEQTTVPGALYQVRDDFMGGSSLLTSTATVMTGVAVTILDDLFEQPDAKIEVYDDGTLTYTVEPAFGYVAAYGLFELLDGTPDLDAAAQLLNSTDSCYQDTTTATIRAVQWTHDDTNLVLRAPRFGGSTATMEISNLTTLNFVAGETTGTAPDPNTITQGSTTPDTTETKFYGHKEPTLFVAAAGAAELLFVPSLEADPWILFPGQDENGDIPSTKLPRDLEVGSSYGDQVVSELAFTDAAYAAPLEIGIQEGPDFVHIFEQRRMLEHTTEESDAMISRDRVIAVFVEFGSNKITLPELDAEEFNFLDPNSGLLEDEVQLGDLVFIEEGDSVGGYVVTDRAARELTLDKVIDESAGTVYRYGNDGEIVPDESDAKISSDTAAFTEDDIGRYVTVWAANREGYDGSYKITAISDDGGGTTTATLDTDPFEYTEQDLHWAIVKAPTEDPDDSGIKGRTALVGLRPVRIYSGTPSEWRVVRVTPDLVREESRVYVALGSETEGPKDGVNQPYKVVRPGAQHISSTAMSGQLDRGLYYFDVLSHSLGGDDIYNIPRNTKLEPVFGTYDSDGYRLEVEDNRFSFSSEEETSMAMSATFLPAGFDDEPPNKIGLEGKAFRVTYDYAPTVAQVQRMMSSETDRVLCANVLARHFLPSYVYFHLDYTGGNKASKIAGELQDHINGLSAVDELDVSKFEKVLHANAVVRYDHPVEVVTLTHDLDRRLVAGRSENRLSDDDIEYNGTNRTTFFIAGGDYSATEDVADIPDGERIYLSRSVATTTVR